MKLAVKVVPGSSRVQISGWLDNVLKIRVKEPPEKGKANLSVRKLLSEALDLSLDKVQIVAGFGSSRKTIEIRGLDENDVRRQLDHP